MQHSFKNHELAEHEKLWIQEIYNSESFDPRIAKVKLRDKLPKGFDPRKIDARLVINGKQLTLVGAWHADPNASIFKDIETVIVAITQLITKSPGVEVISAKEIAADTGLYEKDVEIAFGNLNWLGRFWSSATGSSEAKGHSEIMLSNDDSYDAYLDFESVEDLMEERYNRPPSSPDINSFFTSIGSRGIVKSPQSADTEECELKPNTAFVLMAMDPEKPDLEDVYQTIKDVCASYKVNAYRADEIEHQDRITDLILSEIKTCEFLIADLSYERPNVYYEIGYAHANNKRPILYRKSGTKLHFDLSVHNVPQYKNITELRELLTNRLEAILGRSAK
ncbi:MAG: hypothetical protein JSW47_13945 [Phycisphaerales bacterium]|nr:MAG: hypothetical protein JSW47_13945 [Phycisphaerales bacterium]